MKPKKSKKGLDLKNPFNLWSFVLIVLGAILGGLIGALSGALYGSLIAVVGKKHINYTKKIIIGILFTLASIITYVILAIIFLGMLS